MTRELLFGLIITGFLALTSMAKADDTYIGIDFTQAKLELPRTSGSVNMLRGRFGVIVLPETASRFGFESHMAFGLSEVSATRMAGTFSEQVQIEMESILGLYMRAEFFTAGIVGFYGLVGFSAAQTGPAMQALNDDGTARFINADPSKPVFNSDSSSSLSFGVGATFFINKYITLQIETMQLVSADAELDFDVSSFSVGVTIPL